MGGRRKDEDLIDRHQDEILCAATVLFAERGYPNADIQILADRLGIAKGTIYRYFPTKECLFLATVDRGMDHLQCHVATASDSIPDPLDRLTAAIRAYLGFFAVHPDLAELLIWERAEFRDRKTPTYLDHRAKRAVMWRAEFRQLIEAGRIRPLDVDRLIDQIGDLVYGTMFANHFTGRQRDVDAQAKDLIDLIRYGIVIPPSGNESGRE